MIRTAISAALLLFTMSAFAADKVDFDREINKHIAFGGGVVGFYDPVTKVLKVRGTDLTPYRREVIAHELTHALDDQVHGLDDLTGVGLVDEQYRLYDHLQAQITRRRRAFGG